MTSAYFRLLAGERSKELRDDLWKYIHEAKTFKEGRKVDRLLTKYFEADERDFFQMRFRTMQSNKTIL